MDRDTADGFGGASEDEGGEADASAGMEITFAPGLSEKTSAEIDPNETSLEAYKRKMRDRRKAEKEKREKARAVKNGEVEEEKEEQDEFFGGSSGEEEEEEVVKKPAKGGKTKSKKDDQPDTTSAHLDLLTLPTPSTNPLAIDDSKHFSMTDIIKEEKNAGAKKRKRAPHKKTKTAEMREKDKELGDAGFEIDTKDERFQKLNVDHRFAIDPSHPQYVFFFLAKNVCPVKLTIFYPQIQKDESDVEAIGRAFETSSRPRPFRICAQHQDCQGRQPGFRIGKSGGFRQAKGWWLWLPNRSGRRLGGKEEEEETMRLSCICL